MATGLTPRLARCDRKEASSVCRVVFLLRAPGIKRWHDRELVGVNFASECVC